MITVSCDNVKTGYSVAYAFLLLAIVMQLFFSGGYFIYYLYRDDAELWEIAIRKIFSLYPAFHYSKIFSEIAYKSCSYFHLDDARWVEGTGY